jgi:hypothetical protein
MLITVLHYSDGARTVQPSPTDELNLAIAYAKIRLHDRRGGRKSNIRSHATVEDSVTGEVLWDSRNLNS